MNHKPAYYVYYILVIGAVLGAFSFAKKLVDILTWKE